MNRIRLYALIVVATLVLLTSKSAQADQAKLLVCVEKCTAQFHICITGQEPNLSVVCNGVAECNGLDQSDLTAFHNVCDLCIKGVTANCPGGGGKAETEPPATDKTPPASKPPQPLPDTFESRCKSLGGEPITDIDPNTQKPVRICLTLRGLHHRLSVLEAEMNKRKGGQAVPPELGKKIEDGIAQLNGLLARIQQLHELTDYEKSVKRLGDGLLARMATEIRRVDDKNWEQDVRLDDLQKKVYHPAPQPVVQTAAPQVSLRPALLGLYVGPYYGRNLRDHYGVALHAVGMEMGVLPSLSQTGAWRLELNFGAGYGGYNKADANGTRIGENLWEMHGHVGPRYTWDSGVAFTFGLGMNRRATFSHDDVAATWIGAFVQPSYSLTSKDGHGLYILGRLGVGNTHYQHAIVDTTGNKRDFEFNIGLGYAFAP